MKKTAVFVFPKFLEYYVNQIISEEQISLLEQEDEKPDDIGGDDDIGGLEDLSFGDEGEEIDAGEEGDIEGIGGEAGLEAGEEGEEGDEEDFDDEAGDGGGIGGGFGGFGGGLDDTGGPDGGDEEEGEEEADGIEPGETLLPEDPIQATIDIAVDMLKTTGNAQEILNAVKASIQRNFTDFEEAAPVIKGLWDTQQPILKVVARKLIIFIRGV